jgi:hypothetical protein
MSGDEILLHLRLTVKGIEVGAQVLSLTPETVLLKIDPKTPWDRDALHCLSVAFETIAKTLPLKQS